MAIDRDPSPIYIHLLQSLLIGVPSIDNEHDELLGQLDILASYPDAHPNTEKFSEILSQLGGQIRAHFANEEQFFRSIDMPEIDVECHTQAHTDILDQYTQLNFDLMQGKTFSRSVVLLMVKAWMVEHVVCFDINIKKYLPTIVEEHFRENKFNQSIV